MKARWMAVAAGLALIALGIGLGAGPLQGDPDRLERQVAQQQAAVADRDRQIATLREGADLAGAYADATAARVLAGRLSGRSVAVVSVAGLDPAVTERAESALVAAGARIDGRVLLEEKLLNPSSQGLVDALSSQVLEQTPGLVVPPGADGYARSGALIGRALGVPAVTSGVSAAGTASDEASMTILAGLEAAGLVREVEVTARSGLVLFLLPEVGGTGRPAALASIVQGVAQGVPTVLAGPEPAPGSALALVREGAPLASTVDTFGDPLSVVMAALALVERSAGGRGDYGPGLGDGALPPLS